MTKKAILVVSYGSSYKEEREKSIGGIEEAIAHAFPDYTVYRAFTSESIIKRIEEKDGIRIDTVRQAMERILNDGVTELIMIQTHLVKGKRQEALALVLEDFRNSFNRIRIAEPLLESEKNIEAVADVLKILGDFYDDGNTAICFAGHGIEESSNRAYEKIQSVLRQRELENYYIGTLSARPSLYDICCEVQSKRKYRRVVILPLMLVSGYHVHKDLIGPGENSWKHTFIRAGYEVTCITKGLGEEPLIQNIFAEHLKSVIL